MKKIFLNWYFMLITATILLLSATITYAGEWKQQNNQTWYYDNGNGTILSDGWYWLDGNGDGISECYYFDKSGVLLQSGITPDGYTVNSDGAWIADYIVQTKVETQNIKSKFNANEKIFWKNVFTAYYYVDFGYSFEFNMQFFMMVFLSENSLGAYYTTDNHFYQIPKFTLQQLTKNIFGESIYTSNNYSWTNDFITESNGEISFYAGDFGAELPFAEINSIKQINNNLLELSGIVGDKYQPTTYKTFNAQLEYLSNSDYPYSCFTLKNFIY